MAERICWNCDTATHLAPVAKGHYSARGDFWTRAYICDHCQAESIAKLPHKAANTSYYTPGRADDAFEEPGASVTWLPETVLGRRFDDVPNPIDDAASEAYACYSIRSYRAAILMARSVVEAVAKQQGVTSGRLYNKIDALEERRIISPLLKEQAHEIRFMGNDMAHGDFTQEVTEEECDDVLNFMSVLLEAIYQQPAKLTRFQEQRKRRKEGSAADPAAVTGASTIEHFGTGE